jgi:phage-related protein (TIGR01555 family)
MVKKPKSSNSKSASAKPVIANSGSLQEALFGSSWPFPSEQISQTDTMFKNLRGYLISNMRQLLSQVYCEYGIVRTVIDVPVDDAFRGGVIIKSKQLSEDQVRMLSAEMDREGDILVYAQSQKWKRLFGGSGTLILTDQDPKTPLDLKAIRRDSPLEFRDVDMWELYYTQYLGADHSVQIVPREQALNEQEFYDYYGQKVHFSRVLKHVGIKPPSFIRPRLRGWGLSELEVMVRSINQYLKSTDLVFEVLDEFKVDVFKIFGLANTLAQKDGLRKVYERVRVANSEKNYRKALTMDSQDDWDHKELSFAGVAETMSGIRMQLASDVRMPLTKLFGISATGFNSGEDDIENYNSMVESTIRHPAKYDVRHLAEIRCQRLFQMIPDDLDISFRPLRVLGAEQEENVKTQKFNRVIGARQASEITPEEFRDAVNADQLLPIQLKTDAEIFDEVGMNKDEDNESIETLPDGGESTSKIQAREAKDAKEAKEAKT